MFPNGNVSDIKIRQAKLELTQELYHMLRILYLVLYSGYIIAIVEKRDCTNSYLKANRVSIAITSIVTPQTRYPKIKFTDNGICQQYEYDSWRAKAAIEYVDSKGRAT